MVGIAVVSACLEFFSVVPIVVRNVQRKLCLIRSYFVGKVDLDKGSCMHYQLSISQKPAKGLAGNFQSTRVGQLPASLDHQSCNQRASRNLSISACGLRGNFCTCREVEAALQPGAFVLVDACSPNDLQQLHASLGGNFPLFLCSAVNCAFSDLKPEDLSDFYFSPLGMGN